MNKNKKLILKIIVIVLVILIVIFSVRTLDNKKVENYSENQQISESEEEKNYDDEVLEVPENKLFVTDLVGTWLTEIEEPGSDEVEYQGFVLRPNGTAVSINLPVDFKSWRIENYKLIFTIDSEMEINEMSYVVDYIGNEGLILRVGDTTVQYSLEAK